MTTVATTPSSATPAPAQRGLAALRPASVAYPKAFLALLQRDLHVLRMTLPLFIIRTVMQPLLLMFVFTYVFPKIGQGVGGSGAEAEAFTTVLVAGVVGLAIIFQGIQAVALPLVQEFGYSKEIEDRVLAPLPTKWLGVQKIATGTINALIAAALVFPIAAIVPSTPVNLHITWWILLTLAPLAGWVAAALGLVLGTKVAPQQVTYLFALVVLPLTFLGCVYYPWKALSAVRWLQVVVLINPLVYMCEGFRAALTNVEHMNLFAVYGALIGFGIVLTWIGVGGLQRRVVS
jgi:ABC-2 type transport system permease protein